MRNKYKIIWIMKKNKHTYVVSMPLSVRSTFRKRTSKIYEKQKKSTLTWWECRWAWDSLSELHCATLWHPRDLQLGTCARLRRRSGSCSYRKQKIGKKKILASGGSHLDTCGKLRRRSGICSYRGKKYTDRRSGKLSYLALDQLSNVSSFAL